MLALGFCVVLSGCGVAPGMRMTDPATLPVSGGDANTPATSMPVPIAEINATLIRQLSASAATAGAEQWKTLSGRPAPYTLGVGTCCRSPCGTTRS